MRAQFSGDLRAPASARTFVTRQLAALRGQAHAPPIDDIVLIVSELVTNSVRAGAAVIAVQLEADEHRVDVRVTDDADGWPTARAARSEDQTGRGLAIVDRLADAWSATAETPGKTVTATWYR